MFGCPSHYGEWDMKVFSYYCGAVYFYLQFCQVLLPIIWHSVIRILLLKGGEMVTLFCCIFLFGFHCPSNPAQVFCASPASLSAFQWLFPCVCSVTPQLVATMGIPYSAVLGSRRAELQSDTKTLWMKCTELPGFGNHVLHQAGERFHLCVFN